MKKEKPFVYKGQLIRNQSDLFEIVWSEREHVSDISGKPLLPKGHSQWHWQFLHIVPKGSYPKWKLNPDNIILGTVEEHLSQDSIPEFFEKRQELTKEYYKTFYGKTF